MQLFANSAGAIFSGRQILSAHPLTVIKNDLYGPLISRCVFPLHSFSNIIFYLKFNNLFKKK